ncbi:hypothetical protein [Mycobacteroides salmoniphilum]|uniref:hypothetical protein n=1 Tax=Mycobacteroides salmoniphilum TaxID=404941 RepID=UPI000994850A|nr:hypothetical protein [Mycobacteroides salmoniphilum]
MFQYLIALNPGGKQIVKINITTGESTVLVSGADAFPDGLVVDPARKYMYWTNMGSPALPEGRVPESDADLDFYRKNGSLERAELDGSGRTYLLPEGSFVTGKQLTADWVAGRLYWSDREGTAVKSVRLDGTDLQDEVVVATTDTDREVLRNQCVGIAIDEVNKVLYWTQKGPSKGGDGRIFRTSLTAPVGERRVETLWSQLPEPIDLELDPRSGFMYWTDRGAPPRGNTLNRARIPGIGEPGGEITVISDDYHEAIGLAIDPEAGLGYVGDLSGQIRVVNLDGSAERVLFKSTSSVTGIAGV